MNPKALEMQSRAHSVTSQEDRAVCLEGTSDARLCRPDQRADGSSDHSSEDSKEPRLRITTNDLLDCLLHPDIINRVTELLLEKHQGRDF